MTETGYYTVTLDVGLGDGSVAGAPNLTLKLGVDAASGRVNGEATITQAIAAPGNRLQFPVSGSIHQTGFGTDTLLVALSGQYIVTLPPPAIGSYLAHFSAALAVGKDWTGTGTYEYGNHRVGPCKVSKTA